MSNVRFCQICAEERDAQENDVRLPCNAQHCICATCLDDPQHFDSSYFFALCIFDTLDDVPLETSHESLQLVCPFSDNCWPEARQGAGVSLIELGLSLDKRSKIEFLLRENSERFRNYRSRTSICCSSCANVVADVAAVSTAHYCDHVTCGSCLSQKYVEKFLSVFPWEREITLPQKRVSILTCPIEPTCLVPVLFRRLTSGVQEAIQAKFEEIAHIRYEIAPPHGRCSSEDERNDRFCPECNCPCLKTGQGTYNAVTGLLDGEGPNDGPTSATCINSNSASCPICDAALCLACMRLERQGDSEPVGGPRHRESPGDVSESAQMVPELARPTATPAIVFTSTHAAAARTVLPDQAEFCSGRCPKGDLTVYTLPHTVTAMALSSDIPAMPLAQSLPMHARFSSRPSLGGHPVNVVAARVLPAAQPVWVVPDDNHVVSVCSHNTVTSLESPPQPYSEGPSFFTLASVSELDGHVHHRDASDAAHEVVTPCNDSVHSPSALHLHESRHYCFSLHDGIVQRICSYRGPASENYPFRQVPAPGYDVYVADIEVIRRSQANPTLFSQQSSATPSTLLHSSFLSPSQTSTQSTSFITAPGPASPAAPAALPALATATATGLTLAPHHAVSRLLAGAESSRLAATPGTLSPVPYPIASSRVQATSVEIHSEQQSQAVAGTFASPTAARIAVAASNDAVGPVVYGGHSQLQADDLPPPLASLDLHDNLGPSSFPPTHPLPPLHPSRVHNFASHAAPFDISISSSLSTQQPPVHRADTQMFPPAGGLHDMYSAPAHIASHQPRDSNEPTAMAMSPASSRSSASSRSIPPKRYRSEIGSVNSHLGVATAGSITPRDAAFIHTQADEDTYTDPALHSNNNSSGSPVSSSQPSTISSDDSPRGANGRRMMPSDTRPAAPSSHSGASELVSMDAILGSDPPGAGVMLADAEHDSQQLHPVESQQSQQSITSQTSVMSDSQQSQYSSSSGDDTSEWALTAPEVVGNTLVVSIPSIEPDIQVDDHDHDTEQHVPMMSDHAAITGNQPGPPSRAGRHSYTTPVVGGQLSTLPLMISAVPTPVAAGTSVVDLLDPGTRTQPPAPFHPLPVSDPRDRDLSAAAARLVPDGNLRGHLPNGVVLLPSSAMAVSMSRTPATYLPLESKAGAPTTAPHPHAQPTLGGDEKDLVILITKRRGRAERLVFVPKVELLSSISVAVQLSEVRHREIHARWVSWFEAVESARRALELERASADSGVQCPGRPSES